VKEGYTNKLKIYHTLQVLGDLVLRNSNRHESVINALLTTTNMVIKTSQTFCQTPDFKSNRIWTPTKKFHT